MSWSPCCLPFRPRLRHNSLSRRRRRGLHARLRQLPSGRADGRAAPDALRAYTPEAIVNALTNGKMAAQGATLTTAERVAVAQFLTGRTIAAVDAPRRTSARPLRPPPIRCRVRAGWPGATTPPTPYTLPQGGLTAQDLPRLKLNGRSRMRARPRPACSRRWRAASCSPRATTRELHALDPKTGCTYWTYSAEFGIRSALSVWPYRSGNATRYAVLFGDQSANAYAVDSVTGQLVWKRKADAHPFAAITGAIAVADGKAFVPDSGARRRRVTAGRATTRAAPSAAT